MNDIIETVKNMPLEMAATEIKRVIDQPELAEIDAKLKELQRQKKEITGTHTALKDYLRENMEECGIKTIECKDFTISLIKGRDNIKITDESLLPEEYRMKEIVYTPYKDKIKADMKAGKDIPGAEMTKTKAGIKFS